MPLQLYLDDCNIDENLVELLRGANHHVVTSEEANLAGCSDGQHARYAIDHNLALVTYNARDFRPMRCYRRDHPGIIFIYQDNDADKDMSNSEIVLAIGNVAAAYSDDIRNQMIDLNHYRYSAD